MMVIVLCCINHVQTTVIGDDLWEIVWTVHDFGLFVPFTLLLKQSVGIGQEWETMCQINVCLTGFMFPFHKQRGV